MMIINTEPKLEPHFVALIDGSTWSAENLEVEGVSHAIVVASSPSAAIDLIDGNLRKGIQVAGVLGLAELKKKLEQMEAMDPSKPDMWIYNDTWKSRKCPY